MPCEIKLESIQGAPPYLLGNQPSELRVVGRCTADCTEVRVTVRAGGAGSVPIVDQVVTVEFPQPGASPGPLPGLFQLPFSPPNVVAFHCGDQLWVDAVCLQDATCSDGGMLPIECKDPVPGGPGTDPEDPVTDPPVGDPWPPWRCLFTGAAAAMSLLAAMACLALGIGTQNVVLISTGTALIGAAAIAWALWDFWCNPSLCTRLGVLCWVLKRGFIAALPVIPLSSSTVILLVVIVYGTAAGLLVNRLRALDCYVPSAKLPLTQIPI